MIMLADWHPDIIEFIISKMQNPRILRFLIEHTNDNYIKQLAKDKLKFKPLTNDEFNMYQQIIHLSEHNNYLFGASVVEEAKKLVFDGGRYEVTNPDFLTGANISVAITKDFMEAVENDTDYNLKFPALDTYTKRTKKHFMIKNGVMLVMSVFGNKWVTQAMYTTPLKQRIMELNQRLCDLLCRTWYLLHR